MHVSQVSTTSFYRKYIYVGAYQSSLVDRLDFLDPHPHCLYKMGVVKVCYKTFFGPPLGAVGVSIYRECMLE